MEGRLRSLFLIFGAMFIASHANGAQNEVPDLDSIQNIESVIQPEVPRTSFDESKIAVNDIELIPSIGLLAIEDFGTNLTLNIKLNYHVSEDYFVGFEIGRSEAGKTSYELLSGGAPLLNDDQRILEYYLFTLGYNILPGEAFATDNVTYNTALYLTTSIGSIDFAGDTHFGFTIGAGYRVLISNFSSVYLDFRDHTFNMEILGEDKLTHNLEISLGYSFYF